MTQDTNFLTFDRLINIHQSLRLEQNFILNKALFNAQLSQNAKLSSLNRQLSEANYINKQILANQINELKREEEQRFYKSLAFKCFEIIDQINTIENQSLQIYFIQAYSPGLKQNLEVAKNSVDEISDKKEIKNHIDILDNLNKVTSIDFISSPLSQLGDTIKDYKQIEDNINEELSKIKNEIKRFPIPTSGLFGLNNKNRIAAIQNRDAIQKIFDDKLSEKNKVLENHNLHSLYNSILSLYPDFESISESITDIENNFNNKFEIKTKKNNSHDSFDSNNKDSLFEDAARLIVQNQQGSASLLQRRLKLGYNRAGRLIEQLEAAGIVGPNEGKSARQVLIHNEVSLEQLLEQLNKS